MKPAVMLAIAVSALLAIAVADAQAQTCFGLAATSGCRINGKVGPCVGTEGKDRIQGTDGNDVIVALGGNDMVTGQKGADVICGGEGDDRIHAGTLGALLDGGGGNDDINGSGANDEIAGGTGDDSLDGGGGDDSLDGGADTDKLDGGAGVDTCVSGESVQRCEDVVTTTTTTSTTTSTTTTSSTTTTTSTTTSTTVPPTTTTSSTTSTTAGPTTTTSTTTTTLGACGTLKMTMHAGHGASETFTELDLGWVGLGHDQDLADGARITLELSPASGACAGQKDIIGIDPTPGNCRCANDNRAICDEPFVADTDDCGGQVCNCYMTPPEPLTAGGVPTCLVRRLTTDVTGTWNVTTGSGDIDADLSLDVYVGPSQIAPCPMCAGECLDPPHMFGRGCVTNSDCGATGFCTPLDTVPNDGVREGRCSSGANDGLACDVNSFDATFPFPGGGSYSLDCLPSAAQRISGTGLAINFDLSTGTFVLLSTVPCTGGDCPCGGPAGVGENPEPNSCSDDICRPTSGDEGQCVTPIDKACDGALRASGDGFVNCVNNADCDAVSLDQGVDVGDCTLSKPRACFLDPIVATGDPDPSHPTLVAIGCVPATQSAATNAVNGLPGPMRVYISTTVTPAP